MSTSACATTVRSSIAVPVAVSRRRARVVVVRQFALPDPWYAPMSSRPSSPDEASKPTSVTGKQALAALRDRVEHGLRIGDRVADRGEDFARGPLLVERFLGLVEQADVLERDRRLIAEGLQQVQLRAR